jgi:hypothetical protein
VRHGRPHPELPVAVRIQGELTLADEELQHRAQRADRFQRLPCVGERMNGTQKAALAADEADNRAPMRREAPPQTTLERRDHVTLVDRLASRSASPSDRAFASSSLICDTQKAYGACSPRERRIFGDGGHDGTSLVISASVRTAAGQTTSCLGVVSEYVRYALGRRLKAALRVGRRFDAFASGACARRRSLGTYSDGLITLWDDVWARARSGRCPQVIGEGDAEFRA